MYAVEKQQYDLKRNNAVPEVLNPDNKTKCVGLYYP